MVWHAETSLPKGTDLVVVPGGFSYGDYLRCGAIAARSPVMDAVRSFARDGGLVLGVCNGFQILCESQLLPGVLMRNAGLKFVCRDVHMRVERSDPSRRGACGAPRRSLRGPDPDVDRPRARVSAVRSCAHVRVRGRRRR